MGSLEEIGIIISAVINALAFGAGIGSIICYLILAAFTYYTMQLRRWFTSLNGELVLVDAALSKLDREPRGYARQEIGFSKINQPFSGLKVLNHLWLEFSECIVRVGESEDVPKILHNTAPASEFFKAETIIEKSHGYLNFSSVPNILTSLGILGTFFGIAVGLNTIHLESHNPIDRAAESFSSTGHSGTPQNKTISNADLHKKSDAKNTTNGHQSPDFQNEIGGFVSGIKSAFMASIFGLVMALLFTLMRNSYENKLAMKCANLVKYIDHAFPRAVPESYLIEILYTAKEHLAETKSLAKDLPNRIVHGLADMGVTEHLDAAIRHGVNQGFNAVAESIDRLTTFQTTFIQRSNEIAESIKDVASGFSDISRQVTSTASAFSPTIEALTEVTKILTETTNSLSNVSKSAIIAQDEQRRMTLDVLRSMDGTQELLRTAATIQTEIGKTATEEVRSFRAQYQDFQKNLSTYHETITTSLSNNLSQFDTELARGVKRLSENVFHLNDVLTNIDTSFSAINNSSQNSLKVSNGA